MAPMDIIALALLVACGLLGWGLQRASRQKTALTEQLAAETRKSGELTQHLAVAQAEHRAKAQAWEQTQERLKETFGALAGDALSRNNQAFLDLAKQNLEKLQQQTKADLEVKEKSVEGLVRPIRESLDKVNQQVQALEKMRAEAYGSLTEQVKNLLTSQQKLESETGNLARALHRSETRGHWGELQLKNVLKAAGLMSGRDYEEQVSISTQEGRLRPDVVVRMPNGGNLVIDAKAPVEPFLRAVEAKTEEERKKAMADHIRIIKTHIAQLSGKEYWSQFSPSPDFVVMFIPGESFFIAALEQDPFLIEQSAEKRVVLASPITLIALLRAVSYGWRQRTIEEKAAEISRLGAMLYERLATFTEHFEKVGDSIGKAAGAYNKAIGTLERNVLSAARKFPELGTSPTKDLAELAPVEAPIRDIVARELKSSRAEEE
ncbi:MAG: DNA recombination protein RmuC [Deltaproteobacteria bacterium]|nr:DNA recombination protein RmuC [Deltaproteobacteria bacterium]